MQSVKLNGVFPYFPLCFAMFDNISCTNTLNRAIFIEEQLHISVVYDHDWAINAVF